MAAIETTTRRNTRFSLSGLIPLVSRNSWEQVLSEWFALAGVEMNGSRPWDVQVAHKGFFGRVLRNGSLGLGESYMDSWWECEALDDFFHRVIRARLDKRIPINWMTLGAAVKAQLLNRQTRRLSRAVAREHYDLGNDLYMAFLDPYNQYTCAYFADTEDLSEAQTAKLDLICRKLALSPDDHVLDIGCGWGGFARFAAQHYGCRVTGVTISDEQAAYARTLCEGLPVEILQRDYRDLRGTFDKVLVCGMIEHVGYKNYRRLMQVAYRCLRDNGLFLLQTIGQNSSARRVDPWIGTYIFPNSMLPSIGQISRAIEDLFVMEDWHSFGPHYDRTLMAWYQNFEASWATLKERYGERFRRMWRYYLLSCAGAFRARDIQLWQVLFSRAGIVGGMAPVR